MKVTLSKLGLLTCILGGLLTSGLVHAQTSGSYQTVDRIVAVVNKQAITQRELDARIESTIQAMTAQNVPIPQRAALEQQVLEGLIIQETQLQEARDFGIRVDDYQLDRTIQLIAQQNNLTLAQLRDKIVEQGVPFDTYREDLRMDILLTRLRERAVESAITITEHEIDEYIKLHSGGADVAPPVLTLAQILIHVPEGVNPTQLAALRAKAEEIHRQVLGPVDFAKIAANVSDGPEALQGGVLGTRSADRWPDLFIQAVNNLAVGQVSAIIQSDNGFHILKLVDKQAASAGNNSQPVIARQTQVSQILIRPSEILTLDQAHDKIKEIRQRITQGNVPFADMARQYSNDPSAPSGGDMGWISEGQMVPQFEEAMNQLSPNVVSEPIETPYGWHLILVHDRRNQDVSGEVRRIEARRQLYEDKVRVAFEDWARQLRDRAYVEIRLTEND